MSSQSVTPLTLESLGIDPWTFSWSDLASCRSIDIELITSEDDIFFDLYEKDPVQARQTDEMCLRCPVIKECFFYGQENGETGVFGGFYLEKGEASQSRNKHKTIETAEALMARIFDD